MIEKLKEYQKLHDTIADRIKRLEDRINTVLLETVERLTKASWVATPYITRDAAAAVKCINYKLRDLYSERNYTAVIIEDLEELL